MGTCNTALWWDSDTVSLRTELGKEKTVLGTHTTAIYCDSRQLCKPHKHLQHSVTLNPFSSGLQAKQHYFLTPSIYMEYTGRCCWSDKLCAYHFTWFKMHSSLVIPCIQCPFVYFSSTFCLLFTAFPLSHICKHGLPSTKNGWHDGCEPGIFNSAKSRTAATKFFISRCYFHVFRAAVSSQNYDSRMWAFQTVFAAKIRYTSGMGKRKFPFVYLHGFWCAICCFLT